MKGFDDSTYLIGFIVSNAVALFLVWAAWKKPRLARLLFFLLFAWASATNWTTALRNPTIYTEYAEYCLLDSYREFILGWFSRHIREMVVTIAICQALIAVSMLLEGWVMKIGCIGAVLFLLGIAPLGLGSAFPFSLIASFALFLILKSRQSDYLRSRRSPGTDLAPLP